MAQQAETARTERPQATAAPRKRQARGERRMAELLRAAGEVFAQSGYSAATTNAIAARAGVSPGTLYQYFPNKDAIADAVAEQYTTELRAVMDSVLGSAPQGMPLPELLDVIIDPLVAFHIAHPACIVLFVGPDSPQHLTELHLPLHAAMLERIGALLAVLAPQLPAERLQRSAEVAVHMFKGVMPLVLASAPQDRPAYVAELKLTFEGYFGLLLDLP
ncbi:TetR/AcrR family transcriptional regulator [Streptacidiphilus sp. PB12-B1b]|uniref:TetR/AcrR family transcriptional regulator n=1 Tax=Streptacidiphilus sp. PB12-B1b TaxID=2705012 RepID=UPI0015F8BA04|nr:TetR/AcrR family transcriptional regulator [Streptacidiphilus sp. PB12-B1b]QMU78768.1 TetR/AcrR family transcriptional regulator [Streptacidiphilus sp. PB12-B1b]